MEGITEITETKGEVSSYDMERRIIDDIKEMDMDALKALIEHMYPVTVSDKEGEEGETLVIESNQEGLTLKDIF